MKMENTRRKNQWHCLVVLVALAVFFGNAGAMDDFLECPFECFHNSTCALSDANFSDHPQVDGNSLWFHQETSSDGKHCACLHGYTGLRCARPFTSCNDSNKNHKCYNGGKCIDGIFDIYGNDQFFCDCEPAIDPVNGTRFVGKFCEQPAINSCDDDGEVFCVNGKKCKENYQDDPLEPCQCGEEFEGKHCEFKKGEVPECTQECHNGGKCRLGVKNIAYAKLGYEDLWQATFNTMHCECPENLFGAHCDIEAVVCGQHHCFNNGTCVLDGNGTPQCDCTTARTAEASYAGKFCQHKSTTFCEDQPDADGHLYCVNGGECKKGGAHLGCDCPSGYDGPMCEVNLATEQVAPCTLRCDNGGKCRKGSKDYSLLGEYGKTFAHLTNATYNEDFEHCVCPDGFTGLTCETEVQICGNREHICFHGAKCEIDDEGNHACKCETIFTDFNAYAGRYCEHSSSSVCTTTGQLSGNNPIAYCVNNGECVALTKPTEHLGCICQPGFEGNHCEVVIGNDEVVSQQPSAAEASDAGFILFSSLSAVVLIVLLASGAIWYRRSQKENFDHLELKPATTASTDSADGLMLDMGPETDFDGNELVNIEIL